MRWLAASAGAAAGAYAAYAGIAWLRYGRPRPPSSAEMADDLLDRFMPAYEVAERHSVHVEAPAEVTLAAARELDLLGSPVARLIVRAREIVLGARRDDRQRPHGLIAEVLALGWGVLAEVPGREIVFGAITRPWEANVEFHAVPPDYFATFAEPGYVKIAWTLRADTVGAGRSTFRTETRAIATDPVSRAKFRWYWSCLSPGIILIRRSMLGPLRREAERRARDMTVPGPPTPRLVPVVERRNRLPASQ